MSPNNEDKGLIFDIQRFCIHDGPGIRTTVFFKGCNLRCYWCHNPESWDSRTVLSYYKNRCIGCGLCADACVNGCHEIAGQARNDGRGGDTQTRNDGGAHTRTIDRRRCILCGACVRACVAGALSMTGKLYDVGEVMGTVAADAPFYVDSGGGLTCSGGEPLLQSGFASRLLENAKTAGFHTALDTAGHVGYGAFESVLPHTDLVLYDLKCMDAELHKKVTGADNRLIIENLRRLSRDRAIVWVRVPVIPGMNDNLGNMRATAELLADMPNVARLELLPCHNLGSGKYESIGIEAGPGAALQPPDEDSMETLASAFTGAKYEVVI
ncbi:MAG: glycyl-radical enzyme activating protein [Oscillospiraceae bacterium]|nr:glycyl-radical enzyme activating protein [Oscillospiraceae bacterium]